MYSSLQLMAVQVKNELEKMEWENIITIVEGQTDQCVGIAAVPKQNKKVRIRLDLTQLNKCVKQERHILPYIDHTLAQLSNAKLFSKIIANSGFWQTELSKQPLFVDNIYYSLWKVWFQSSTFWYFIRPQVVSQHYLKGAICLMDHILVHGSNQQEHDKRLFATLERLQECHINLNRDKYEFLITSAKFLGQGIKSARWMNPVMWDNF